MSSRSIQLAQQRRNLQARSELQRQQAQFLRGHIESKLASADRAIALVTSAAKNPLVLIATVAGTLVLGPWRIVRWIGHGAMIYRAVHLFRSLMR